MKKKAAIRNTFNATLRSNPMIHLGRNNAHMTDKMHAPSNIHGKSRKASAPSVVRAFSGSRTWIA